MEVSIIKQRFDGLKRQLKSNCEDQSDCFNCVAFAASCTWTNSSSNSSEDIGKGTCSYVNEEKDTDKEKSRKKWYVDFVDTCPLDPKGLCNITRNENKSRLDAQINKDVTNVPKNYFCTFDFDLEQYESSLIDIWRRSFSIRRPKEVIDVRIVQYKAEDEEETYSIDYLSDTLIIKNSQLNRMSLNAQAQIQFHNIPRKTRLYFYVRTMYMQSRGSWRVIIDKDGKAINWLL